MSLRRPSFLSLADTLLSRVIIQSCSPSIPQDHLEVKTCRQEGLMNKTLFLFVEISTFLYVTAAVGTHVVLRISLETLLCVVLHLLHNLNVK